MSDATRSGGRVEPNAREHRYATSLAVDQWRNPEALAELLAFAREGGTLDGPRQLVSASITVSRLAIESTGGDVERATVRALWRRWVDELARAGLRPCGWPAVQRTYLDFTALVSDVGPKHRRGLVEVDPDGPRPWTFLELGLTCEAVPAGHP